MGAALSFDDSPQFRHYLIMRRGRALIVKRGLDFCPEPAIVRLGFFSRSKLGRDRQQRYAHGLEIIRQFRRMALPQNISCIFRR